MCSYCIPLFWKINNRSKIYAIVSALVGVLLEAVIICGEIIVLRAARIRFFIVIRFSEVVGAIVCYTEYGGIFSGLPGGFNDVGSDLNCGFC